MWHPIYSRAKVIFENPLSVAITVGTSFPNVGKQLAWKQCCFGAKERKTTKASQQTPSCLNACGFVFFLIYLFYATPILCTYFISRMVYITYIHLLILYPHVLLSQLSLPGWQFWRVWGWIGLKKDYLDEQIDQEDRGSNRSLALDILILAICANT